MPVYQPAPAATSFLSKVSGSRAICEAAPSPTVPILSAVMQEICAAHSEVASISTTIGRR